MLYWHLYVVALTFFLRLGASELYAVHISRLVLLFSNLIFALIFGVQTKFTKLGTAFSYVNISEKEISTCPLKYTTLLIGN